MEGEGRGGRKEIWRKGSKGPRVSELGTRSSAFGLAAKAREIPTGGPWEFSLITRVPGVVLVLMSCMDPWTPRVTNCFFMNTIMYLPLFVSMPAC